MITQRFLLILLFLTPGFFSSAQKKIVVAQDGSGDFSKIQEAINSIPDSSKTERIILIKNGVYNEKLYIGKSKLLLLGEDKKKVVITYAMSNVIYKTEHKDNYSGTVNLDGDDITLRNLTIQNTFGKDAPDSVRYTYKDPKSGQTKSVTVARTAHQFALRGFKSTRLKVIDCILLAWGADTVSPWDSNQGMYYFKDCVMQGGVDFYCPRGWAYAEDCTFICQSGTAAIWHDGSENKDMKSVWKNCKFIGEKQYKLGRYHHDSQFYLINCSFDENMQDARIYKAQTAETVHWGAREYYYDCHRKGGDYQWFKNNLSEAPGSPSAKQITAAWTFGGQWDPTLKNK